MTAHTVDSRNVDEQISRTVNALRGYNDLTVKALAAETGIDEDTLRRRLHGSTWQASEVYRVAMYFGVDVQRFYEPLPQLRHRYGTGMYRVSTDFRMVQEVMGHDDPSSTAGYVAFAPSRAVSAAEQLALSLHSRQEVVA